MQALIRPSAEPGWSLAALGAVHVQLRSGFGHVRAFLAQEAQSLLYKFLQMRRQTRPQHNFPAGSAHVPRWRAAHRALVCLSAGHWAAQHQVTLPAHFTYPLAQAQGSCASATSKPTQPSAHPREQRRPPAVSGPGDAEAVAFVRLKGKRFHRSLTAQRLWSPSSTGLTETPARTGEPHNSREGSWVLPFPPGSRAGHTLHTPRSSGPQPRLLCALMSLRSSTWGLPTCPALAWPAAIAAHPGLCAPAPVMLMDAELCFCPSLALFPQPCLAIPASPPRCPSPSPEKDLWEVWGYSGCGLWGQEGAVAEDVKVFHSSLPNTSIASSINPTSESIMTGQDCQNRFSLILASSCFLRQCHLGTSLSFVGYLRLFKGFSQT